MKIKSSRFFILLLSAIAVIYFILLIPEKDVSISDIQSRPANRSPFVWDQDEYWRHLESRFIELRSMENTELILLYDSIYNRATDLLQKIDTFYFEPEAKEFDTLETLIFEIAPVTAVCPDRYHTFAEMASKIRKVIKKKSELWNMDSPDTRTTLYRLIYGARTALEQIMLQMPDSIQIQNMTIESDEPSQTPAGIFLGIPIHSGDILISRGTVPTSALIARGNDFPGNFSHSALVYADEKTNEIKLIESHIERGVTISTPEEYLADMKFRILVLRIRADLPQIRNSPMLPHHAAQYALKRAERTHIPYDFSMDLNDTTKWFCSEVVSAAYHYQRIGLWMGLSHISSPGLQRWLAGFGVQNFVTQEPSDLEYDPQLRVIAEWRDMKKLWKEQYDNAVTEVLLNGANSGDQLQFSLYLLPIGRILKGYSVLLNTIGYAGPVPEGMSATQALRNRWYTQRHNEITGLLTKKASEFELVNGYKPPYWQLVALAESIKEQPD